MAQFSCNALFFYCVVPKHKSIDKSKRIIIKSYSICDLVFLQRILKFNSPIIIGHNNWKLDADHIIDVENECRSIDFDRNGKIVFNRILNKFFIKPSLIYGKNSKEISTYEQVYKHFYDDYYSKLTKVKKLDPPPAMYYNAFTKTVNAYVDTGKKHKNIILPLYR